jgi:hypothetical protein
MLGKDKVLCRINSVQNKHNLYYKRIFFCMCIRVPAKSQITFDLQTILVQDQTFHLSNHAQEVTQLLALEYVHLAVVRRSKNMLFKCVFTPRKSHQSRIFDTRQLPILPVICSDRYGIVSTFPSDHTALILVFGLD